MEQLTRIVMEVMDSANAKPILSEKYVTNARLVTSKTTISAKVGNISKHGRRGKVVITFCITRLKYFAK